MKVPKNMREIEESDLSEWWLESMDKEFLAFLYHDLFELVPYEPGMKVLRGH